MLQLKTLTCCRHDCGTAASTAPPCTQHTLPFTDASGACFCLCCCGMQDLLVRGLRPAGAALPPSSHPQRRTDGRRAVGGAALCVPAAMLVALGCVPYMGARAQPELRRTPDWEWCAVAAGVNPGCLPAVLCMGCLPCRVAFFACDQAFQRARLAWVTRALHAGNRAQEVEVVVMAACNGWWPDTPLQHRPDQATRCTPASWSPRKSAQSATQCCMRCLVASSCCTGDDACHSGVVTSLGPVAFAHACYFPGGLGLCLNASSSKARHALPGLTSVTVDAQSVSESKRYHSHARSGLGRSCRSFAPKPAAAEVVSDRLLPTAASRRPVR